MKYIKEVKVGFAWFMVFNATFNNISVISWQSVLLAEETGGPGENHRPVALNVKNEQSRETGNIGYTRRRKKDTICLVHDYTRKNTYNVNKT
jgi:hypothetical protein